MPIGHIAKKPATLAFGLEELPPFDYDAYYLLQGQLESIRDHLVS